MSDSNRFSENFSASSSTSDENKHCESSEQNHVVRKVTLRDKAAIIEASKDVYTRGSDNVSDDYLPLVLDAWLLGIASSLISLNIKFIYLLLEWMSGDSVSRFESIFKVLEVTR